MSAWSDIDNRLQDPQWYTTTEHLDVFARLREEDPVHWAEDDAYGKHYWFVTRYDDVKSILNNHTVFSSYLETRVPRTPRRYTPEERFEKGFDVSIARNDPPIHTKYRRPMNKHFSMPAVNKLRGHVESIVEEILDDIAKKDTVDIVESVAGDLPAKVVLRLLGVPEEDWDEARQAAWQWLAPAQPGNMIDNDPVKTHIIGHTRLLDYCERLAASRRESPRDDFATVLSRAEIDGDQLSVHELRSYFATIIGAGLETTRNAASVGAWAFLTNPDQRQLLREDPSLTATAVEEVLRWASPPRSRFRVATEDTELGGREIAAGDWIIASQTSANRDETVFEKPSKFDITRSPNPHLTFGDGIHMCLGRYLARLELSTLFPRLLTRFPDLELEQEPAWIADNITSGLAHLHVKVGADARAVSV